jgi:hypothetical protein
MDETTVTTEATPETEDVQTPNTALAVVGGTLLGVAAVYLAGTAVRKFKARRAAKAAQDHVEDTDLEN